MSGPELENVISKDGQEYLARMTKVACDSDKEEITDLTGAEVKEYNIGDEYKSDPTKIICSVGRCFVLSTDDVPVKVISVADVDRHFGWTAGRPLFDEYYDENTGKKIFRYELSREDIKWTRA